MPSPNLLLDPSLQAQAEQQARMGQGFLDSSVQPLSGVNTGQFYVAPSPLQALAKVLQARTGKQLLDSSLQKSQQAWQQQIGMIAGNMFGQGGAGSLPYQPTPAPGTTPVAQPSPESMQAGPTLQGNPAGSVSGDLATALSNNLSQSSGGPVQPTTPLASSVQGAVHSDIPDDLAGAFPGLTKSQLLMRALSDSTSFNKTRDEYNLQRGALTNDQKNANDIASTYVPSAGGATSAQLRTLILSGPNTRTIAIGADQFPFSPISGVPPNFQTLPKAPVGASAGFSSGQPVISAVPGGYDSVYNSSLAQSTGEVPKEAAIKLTQGMMHPVEATDAFGNKTTNYAGNMLPIPPAIVGMMHGVMPGGASAYGPGPSEAQPPGQLGTQTPVQGQPPAAPGQASLTQGVPSAISPANAAFFAQQGKATGDLVTQYQHDANAAQLGAFNARQVLSSLATDPTMTGPNQPFFSKIAGTLSDVPGIGPHLLGAAQGYTADRQYVVKALAQSQAARFQQLGGTGSEAHLDLATEGSAGPAMFGQTVQKLMQQELGLNQATQAKNTWMSQGLSTSPNPVATHQQMQSNWNQNFNLKAFEYLNNPAMAAKEIPAMTPADKANIFKAATWMKQNGIDTMTGAQ